MRAGIVVMMSRWYVALLLGCSFCFFSNEGIAGIGDWKNYTDMKNVRAVASDGQTIWAATSGGVFRFNPSDSTYQKFVNSDGLSTNNVTAIFIDSSGNVWIGQQSGNIDVYNPQTKLWRYITDVALSGKTNRAINNFYQSGNKIYIATAFGVTVFSITKFEFADTYTSFDSAIQAIQPNVSAVRVFQNRVFAATNSGIASSKIGAVNLAAPESWEILSPIKTGNNFAEFGGALYASTVSGMLKFDGGIWNLAFGIGSDVRIISATTAAIIYSESNTLKSVNASGIITVISSTVPSTVSSGTITTDNRIFLGFLSNGIGSLSSNLNWVTYFPNGPNSNAFYQIVVDETGTLWSASGGHASGKGFYSFDGMNWTNYTTTNTPLLLNNDCFAIEVGPNNSKWVSTWGEGIVLVNSKGVPVRRFDYASSGFIGSIRSNSLLSSYIVPSRIGVDRSGNVWFSSFVSTDRNKVLWKMKPDSTWESYPGSPYGSPAFMLGIVIDQNNTKWFTNALIDRTESTTIVFFNESRTIPGSTNGWGTLTENDGVTNERVQSIVVGNNGDIWLGTGSGITIITDPSNPLKRVSKVFLGAIRDLFINSIAVDPLNNKWLGTSKGVFVLSPDGTQLLQQYNIELSGGKMLDNNVRSIAFDHKKGIAYFGTEKGLSTVEIAAVAIKSSFTTIDLSPNPVYLPDHSTVEIHGLVDESTIKVLALNGKVISQFPAQGGGRAFWNCRDGEGRLVASGIYIVVAHNRAGDQVASAKIAVIQK